MTTDSEYHDHDVTALPDKDMSLIVSGLVDTGEVQTFGFEFDPVEFSAFEAMQEAETIMALVGEVIEIKAELGNAEQIRQMNAMLNAMEVI